MNNTPLMKKAVNFVYEKFTKNVGSFLLWVGITGWIISCVNQTIAILINDKIPTKQKKFLIPQEISDGIINTILFAAFTRSFTKVGEKMVQSGRLATKELRDIYKTKLHEGKTIESLIKTEMESINKNSGKALNISELPVMNDKSVSGFNQEHNKKYFNFADGVSFVFSTIGSIISCDFVTPFVRNKIASARQKQYLLSQQNTENKQQPVDPVVINSPVLPAQNKIGTDTYRPKVANMALTSKGSMRV